MKALKAFGIAAAAAAMIMVTGTPANASQASWAPAGSGYAFFNGNFLWVCDSSVDGYRVRAHIRNIPGGTIFISGWAPSQGCQVEGHPSAYDFRACTQVLGCGPWVRKNS